MNKCLCGCRSEIEPNSKYIRGHNRRLPFYPIPILCKCGCNEIVWNKREYISGHNSKGRKDSEKTTELKRQANINKKLSEEHKQKIGRGNKGKVRSEDLRKRWSLSHIGKLVGENNPMFKIISPILAGYSKGEYYESPLQGKIWLRSSYELAYAKWLDFQKILWYYEIETFDLGNTTYTPDFFLPRYEKFIEIKGYMFPISKIKIDKFQEQYPFDLDVLYKEDLIKLGIEL